MTEDRKTYVTDDDDDDDDDDNCAGLGQPDKYSRHRVRWGLARARAGIGGRRDGVWRRRPAAASPDR